MCGRDDVYIVSTRFYTGTIAGATNFTSQIQKNLSNTVTFEKMKRHLWRN